MQVISLVGQKGGSGKSTIAVCLASELMQRGKSVLLVDTDPQATVKTWGAVATEGGRKIPTIVGLGANMHQPGQLDRIAPTFDLTIIDSPPRHADTQRSALMVSSLALLPCGPSSSEIWALASSVELVAEAQKINTALVPRILITRKQSRTALGKQSREALAVLEIPVLKSELGYRVSYQECLGVGLGVTQYAPRDQAAVEVKALTDELLKLLKRK